MLSPFLTPLVSFSAAYDVLGPPGIINIKREVMLWMPDGYESIVGAQATDQGYCSKFNGKIPHSCERSPAIIDLFPGVHDNQKYTYCCKGGIVTSWGQDPAAAVSSFQVSVRLSGTSSTSVKLPRDFYLLRPGLGYTCSGATIMPPSVLFSADGRRKNRVMMSWYVTCTYSQMIVSKYPTCCASFSSFYNPMITPCLSCACGDVPLLQCTNHMCPIRWTLAAQNPNFNNITRVYKFDYKPHNAFGSLSKMFYGIKYYNDLLMQAGPEGNVQTEMILRKDESTFTLDHGWAFSRKVYFNGDECMMPPPDKYPSLPSIAPSNPPLALALAFFLILVPMLLIF
ncbi:hypothetical protein EUGRSUZ_K02542 [Eucalyptus grandis]|uniref:Uncharacterized protein n=2 Tax=Eucalyptus grandis TaxID=71139 RepID=A0ACC3IZQ0_EUCGR|nr:hypothetical protein EUGRSUZ_K02542 [Eucalyptus grandis]